MSARVPPSTLGSLLLTVLQGKEGDRDRGSRGEGSWGGAAVICPGWEEGGDGLLSHLQTHSGASWHLWDIINLTRISGGGDRRGDTSAERREDQREEEALKILSTRFLRSPSPSPLSSSWALTPSASPRSCGLPSALLHHCQHCSGSWDIPCLQIRSTLSEAPLDCWPTGRSDASQSASTSGMLCSWLAARSLRQPWWGRTWHWFRTWWTVTTNQTDMSCLLRDNIWPGICTDVSHTTDKTTSSLKLQRNMLWSSSI